ncbi:MAG TPA: ABC transporter permease [Candidatus Acidoferrum sp.]|jgi:putative ABC transport system permease protein
MRGRFKAFLSRLKALVGRKKLDHDLQDEVAFHLDMREEKNRAAGIADEEARYAARRQFGNLTVAKEGTREMLRFLWIETLLQDLRYGFRMLRKNPGITLIAVITLGLGIGASTTVFSLVDAILLKPLPYPEPGRIVVPSLVSPPGINLGSPYFPWGQVQFRMFTREQTVFQYFGAFQSDSFNLTGVGDPIRLDGSRASADFFPALGISAALGRTYSAEEDRPGYEHEVVLSDTLWRQRFGADPGILGRALQLNGTSYTVIGVMPPNFAFPRAEEMPVFLNFPREAQLWVPAAIPDAPPGGPSEMAVIARVKPGVSLNQVQAQMDLIARHAEQKLPDWKGWMNTRQVPLATQVTGDTRGPLLLVLGAVGVVLLIACSNVANLLLARALARKREFTLRAALGSGRSRLIRQLLTESLLLALAGGAVGVSLAEAGICFAKTFGPANLPRLHEVRMDVSVLCFVSAASLLAGIFFGLFPALAATRENLVESLKEGGQRSAGNSSSPRIQNSLLVSQVALALVLVISAGLLAKTFFHLINADSGFNPQRALTFELSLPPLQYTDQPHIVTLYRNVLDKLNKVPGVQSAGIGETVPLSGQGESTIIRLPDRPAASRKELPYANYTIVSPGYLSAVGTSVIRGRDFLESDILSSLPVTIINLSMAKKFWPNQDPLGKQVGVGSTQYALTTIVGIVADAKHVSLREDPIPEMYVPYTQHVWPSMLTMHVALRTNGDPANVTASVRDAIRSIDPALPLAKLATLSTLVDDSMVTPRFSVLLLASFAALALVLACIGMYGVISYSVSQRTQEIGIRMALGAHRRDVFAMILAHGARLAGLGVAIGLLAAVAATRVMAGLLYGVRPIDAPTFIVVAVFLMVVALVACYVPARRATRVDPMVALRDE